MKKKCLITIILFLFSYYYTHKCIIFLKQNDLLMQEIINKQDDYNQKPINAIITKNTMIPAINGKKINIDKSYKKMKKINKFDDSLLVYDEMKANISIHNHYDKLILSGNKHKNNVSIILNINSEELFNTINKILVSNNVYANILVNKNFNIQKTNYRNILSYNYYPFIDYCLTNKIQINKDCLNNKKYTILTKTVNNYFLTNTKNILSNGSIILYNFNKNNYHELNVIIKYLKSNNYQLVSINELIKE